MRALRTIIVVLLVSLGFLGGYFVGWYLHGENTVRLSADAADVGQGGRQAPAEDHRGAAEPLLQAGQRRQAVHRRRQRHAQVAQGPVHGLPHAQRGAGLRGEGEGLVLRHRRLAAEDQGRPRHHLRCSRGRRPRPQASPPATSSHGRRQGHQGRGHRDEHHAASRARRARTVTLTVQPKDKKQPVKELQGRAQDASRSPRRASASSTTRAPRSATCSSTSSAASPAATCARTSRTLTQAGRAVVHPRPALQRRRPAHPGRGRHRRVPDRASSPPPPACTRPRRSSRPTGPVATEQAHGRARQRLLRQRLGDRHRRPQGPQARRRSSAPPPSARASSRPSSTSATAPPSSSPRPCTSRPTAPTSTRRASRRTSWRTDKPKTKTGRRAAAALQYIAAQREVAA